jgi:hypothetical protein
MKTIKRLSLGCILMLGLVALLWQATARAGAPASSAVANAVPMACNYECKQRCVAKRDRCLYNCGGSACSHVGLTRFGRQFH